MDLEESLGVRSTFFFLNESSRWRLFNLESMMLFIGRYRIHDERIQDAIRVLDEKGWEIGMHGSYYSYQEKSLLEKEKQALEAILGKTVYGSRQHYLNLNIPETWQYQSQLGLAYDSTLGYTRRVGFKWNMTQPFYPRNPATGKAIPILQIPLGIMDVPLMKLPDPWEAALHLIDEANDKQAVLTLNWHQRVFNPWEFQAWQDIYIRIIQESLRREAWVVPLGRIANWWDGLQEGKAGIFE